MKSFASFIVESTAGSYAAFRIDPDSANQLHAHFKNLGVPSLKDPSSYHITTMYSKVPVDIPPSDQKIEVVPTHLDWFESHIDPTKHVLVLRVAHPHLDERFQKYVDAGAEHSHDEFKPHITITLPQTPVNLPEIPKFPIKTAEEYVDKLRS